MFRNGECWLRESFLNFLLSAEYRSGKNIINFDVIWQAIKLCHCVWIINIVDVAIVKTRQSIQWTSGYTFQWTKVTKNSLIRTYFLNYPLISRCGNLKMLSKYSFHSALLSYWKQRNISRETRQGIQWTLDILFIGSWWRQY